MQKLRVLLIILLSFHSLCYSSGQQTIDNTNLKLWYDKPATVWEEALPLGKGKTGAMVFGGIVTEQFQHNDITLWSGYPVDGKSIRIRFEKEKIK